MIFPLVPVPEWLAKALPFFFSPEIHKDASLGAAGYIAFFGIFALVLTVVSISGREVDDTDRSHLRFAIGILLFAIPFILFGGYALMLLFIGVFVFLFWGFFVQLPRKFLKKPAKA